MLDQLQPAGKPRCAGFISIMMRVRKPTTTSERVAGTHAGAPADEALARNTSAMAIDMLNAEADKLLQSMQTPEAQQAMDRAFHATPEQMGMAAHRAARAEQD